MIHLTLGSSDGRPLCHCHRPAHQAMGDVFLALVHASASLLSSEELCLACRMQLEEPRVTSEAGLRCSDAA